METFRVTCERLKETTIIRTALLHRGGDCRIVCALVGWRTAKVFTSVRMVADTVVRVVGVLGHLRRRLGIASMLGLAVRRTARETNSHSCLTVNVQVLQKLSALRL